MFNVLEIVPNLCRELRSKPAFVLMYFVRSEAVVISSLRLPVSFCFEGDMRLRLIASRTICGRAHPSLFISVPACADAERLTIDVCARVS